MYTSCIIFFIPCSRYAFACTLGVASIVLCRTLRRPVQLPASGGCLAVHSSLEQLFINAIRQNSFDANGGQQATGRHGLVGWEPFIYPNTLSHTVPFNGQDPTQLRQPPH